MTTQTTPNTQAPTAPIPAQPQQSVDWRQLDFAADGLVLRSAPETKR